MSFEIFAFTQLFLRFRRVLTFEGFIDILEEEFKYKNEKLYEMMVWHKRHSHIMESRVLERRKIEITREKSNLRPDIKHYPTLQL